MIYSTMNYTMTTKPMDHGIPMGSPNEAQGRGEILDPNRQTHFTGPRAYAFGLPAWIPWIPLWMENGWKWMEHTYT